MKKINVAFFFLFICFSISAQNKTIPNSYIIKNLKEESLKDFFMKSIENADFEQYRLKSKSITLKFENGFDLVLLAAREIGINNSKVLVATYSDVEPEPDSLPLFFIQDTGMITGKVTTKSKKDMK